VIIRVREKAMTTKEAAEVRGISYGRAGGYTRYTSGM